MLPFRLSLEGTLIVDMFHVSLERTYFVCYSLLNAPVWASVIECVHVTSSNKGFILIRHKR